MRVSGPLVRGRNRSGTRGELLPPRGDIWLTGLSLCSGAGQFGARIEWEVRGTHA